MTKRAGQSTHNLEPKRFPQVNRTLVRTDDEVELHRAEAARAGVLHRVLAHAPRDAPAACRRKGHVTAVGHMIATTRLVGPKKVGSNELSLVHGDKGLVV